MKKHLLSFTLALFFRLIIVLLLVFSFQSIHAQSKIAKGTFPTEPLTLFYSNWDKEKSETSQVTLNYSVLSEGEGMRVDFRRVYDGYPNPYDVSNSYNILFLADGSLNVEPKSVLNPFVFSISPHVEVSYKGDYIQYPSVIRAGDLLPDAAGTYEMKLHEKLPPSVYEIKISNRKVEGQELLTIAERQYEAYVITYSLSIVSSVDGYDETYRESKEIIKEWLVPGLGIVKSENDLNLLVANKFSQE